MAESAGQNVFLVGFMGAGKSSVAALLAEHLGWPAADTDASIEQLTGLSIMQIFRRHGEPSFRQMEQQLLQELCRERRRVIALGGGTFCRPEMVALVNNSGFSIWLDVPLEELIRRCVSFHTPRPLARDEAAFRRLFEARLPFYAQAHCRILAGGRTILKVVEEIEQILRWRGLADPAGAPGPTR